MPEIDETHDPERRSWVASANGHPDFPIQNLPLGVFSPPGDGGAPRAGVAIGDMVLDLAAAREAGLLSGEAARAAEAASGGTLNALFALGAAPRRALRARLSELLAEGSAEAERLAPDAAPRRGCTLHLPARIGDYTDFYVGIHHATNVGKLFRPDNPLLPNYKYVPIGYHGRASSVVPSGTPIRRPNGQRKRPDEAAPSFGPCRAAGLRARARGLDRARQRARRADPDRRGGRAHRRLLPAERLVGARHPGLGVPAARAVPGQELRLDRVSPGSSRPEALAPFRVAQPPRPEGDPPPLPYLLDEADQACWRARARTGGAAADAGAEGARAWPRTGSSLSDARHMYWTAAQMVAHHACNGCNLQTGRPARHRHHLGAGRRGLRQPAGDHAGRQGAGRARLRRGAALPGGRRRGAPSRPRQAPGLRPDRLRRVPRCHPAGADQPNMRSGEQGRSGATVLFSGHAALPPAVRRAELARAATVRRLTRAPPEAAAATLSAFRAAAVLSP